MAEPARNLKAYWEDVAKKLAEHPCLVTELSAVRAINADMLAALKILRPRVKGRLQEDAIELIDAAIAKAEGRESKKAPATIEEVAAAITRATAAESASIQDLVERAAASHKAEGGAK
jgi:hypothetical protein